jgi:hypothetical protein
VSGRSRRQASVEPGAGSGSSPSTAAQPVAGRSAAIRSSATLQAIFSSRIRSASTGGAALARVRTSQRRASVESSTRWPSESRARSRRRSVRHRPPLRAPTPATRPTRRRCGSGRGRAGAVMSLVERAERGGIDRQQAAQHLRPAPLAGVSSAAIIAMPGWRGQSSTARVSGAGSRWRCMIRSSWTPRGAGPARCGAPRPARRRRPGDGRPGRRGSGRRARRRGSSSPGPSGTPCTESA